jgi:hypothetical protein
MRGERCWLMRQARRRAISPSLQREEQLSVASGWSALRTTHSTSQPHHKPSTKHCTSVSAFQRNAQLVMMHTRLVVLEHQLSPGDSDSIDRCKHVAHSGLGYLIPLV